MRVSGTGHRPPYSVDIRKPVITLSRVSIYRQRVFRFVTMHAYDRVTDRRMDMTDRQNYDPQDRASIAASRGEN